MASASDSNKRLSRYISYSPENLFVFPYSFIITHYDIIGDIALREYIKEASERGVAVGHFNISNDEALHGIYNAAKKLSEEQSVKVPVIIGVSEGEEEFIGISEVSALIKAIRER